MFAGPNFIIEPNMPMSGDLIFEKSPQVVFGTNSFINVPTILQVDETPLIQTVKSLYNHFTTRFSIYDKDGVEIAKVVGVRICHTDAGKNAGVKLRMPDRMTVCELDGQTLFEIRRDSAAAIAISAELYSPQGVFVRSKSTTEAFLAARNTPLQIGGTVLSHNTISGFEIGVHIKSDGSFAIGSSPSRASTAS